VKAGEMVALCLENRDTAPHSFNIDEFDVHISMQPGESSLALFTASTPGTYIFYCDVPGHRAAGMVSTQIVEP
jgi:nitrite reductase (NO-forming)